MTRAPVLFTLLSLVACQADAAPPATPVASSGVVAVAPTPVSEDPAGHPEQGAEGDDVVPTPVRPSSTEVGAAGIVAEIDRELSAVRSSTYTHHTSIDESRGRFDYDCSGFVDYALLLSAPDAFAEVAKTTVPRPLAKHYVSFFSSLPPNGTRWSPVARVQDLQPGDIVAWLRPADVNNTNTGHVVFVHGPASPYDGRSDAFVVPIADSTHSPHGKADPRTGGRGEGLGVGSIVLLVDPSGHPIGYQWSTAKKSVPHATSVAMARVTR